MTLPEGLDPPERLDPTAPEHPPSAACRAHLTDALEHGVGRGDHGPSCAYCSSRLAAAERLVAALKQPVAVPVELSGAAGLAAVWERIHSQLESGALGRLLAAGMPVVAPPSVAASTPRPQLPAGLLASATLAPPLPSSGQWAAVAARLRDDRHQHRSFVRRSRVVGLALAGTAAAAFLGLFLVSRESRDEPWIVLVDTMSQPGSSFAAGEFSPFSVVRRGH